MNPSFNIQLPDIDTVAAQLMVEAGPTGVSFVILDADHCFSAVVVYPFLQGLNAITIAEQLKEILLEEKYLQQPFKKINIIWTFNESILVPNEFFDNSSNGPMLDLIYGDANKGMVKRDFMFRENIHNVYCIPEPVMSALPSSFQHVDQTHQYSLLPELVLKTGNRFGVVFYNNSLTTILYKEGNLQLIQHFVFQNADDVAYHLLNICENFEINPDEIILQLYGMIDTESNLYSNLYKYFLQMVLAGLPENTTYTEEIQKYPAHFFSHLFTLAKCV